MKLDRKAELDEELNKEQYEQFRGLFGKLSLLQTQTKPDMSFNTLEMSMKHKNATVMKIKKIVRKAKSKVSAVKFERLGMYVD